MRLLPAIKKHFLILLLLFPVGSVLPSTLHVNIDSLQDIIESSDSPDSLLYEAHYWLSWGLKSVRPTQALEHGLTSLDIAEKMKDERKIADALSNIGVIYWQLGNFAMALDYHLEAHDLYTQLKLDVGIARSNVNLGLIFAGQSHYEKALEYYFKGLLIYEQNEHQAGMAVTMNNIGIVYMHQNDFDMSEQYHLMSLDIKSELGDIKGISFSYNNLGLVYQHKNEFDKAMQYFYQALEIRESLNDKREIANTSSNLGHLYLLLDDQTQSEKFLYRALELYQRVDDLIGLAQTYYYLGRLNMQTGDLNQSQQYFKCAIDLADQIGFKRAITDSYAAMATLSALKDDFKAAFKYQKQFTQMKDSIYSEDSRRKIFELQLMYDREKKESEIQLLRKNEQISFLSSQKERLLRSFLIVGVVLTLISLFLLYNRFLIVRNANVLLEEQKDEISQSNEKLLRLNQSLLEQKKKYEELNHQINLSNQKLRESEKNLIEINTTKDKFFSIISHDLRNPFASIVSFSRILKRDIENMSIEELQELALELDKSVLKINNLLENLLQWSRAQTGKIKYFPEYIAVHEIVKDNIHLYKNNAKEKGITLLDNVDDNLPVWADKNMTDTIIRNLLSNALKYTDEGGKITITSHVADHMAYISVKDSGVGMSEESQKKIFRMDTLHSTYGTMDEKGSGLGLLLCKEFVEKQGGSISFESELNKGSIFTFSLPLEEE